MKIAILSDLHLEFVKHAYGLLDKLFPKSAEFDVLVIAGDLHPYPETRHAVLNIIKEHYDKPVLYVTGNHDYYHGRFPSNIKTHETVTIDGVKFALASLWTKLTPADEPSSRGMNDFHLIEGCSFDRWNLVNHTHKMFLKNSNADVIVTHHCPFWRFIHPKYAGNSLNPFFYNDLDPADYPNTKLWIHGHTHDASDNVIEHMRVIVNPLGYPGENPGAKLQIVEL